MEYLKDDSLYLEIIANGRDDYEVSERIRSLLDTDPDVVHRTINYFTMQAEAYKQEKLRLGELQKEKNTNIEFMQGVVVKELEGRMQNSNRKYLETSIGKLAIRRTPPKVNITDISLLPDKFYKIEKKPNLTEIKKAYENGDLEFGCVELTTKYTLTK